MKTTWKAIASHISLQWIFCRNNCSQTQSFTYTIVGIMNERHYCVWMLHHKLRCMSDYNIWINWSYSWSNIDDHSLISNESRKRKNLRMNHLLPSVLWFAWTDRILKDLIEENICYHEGFMEYQLYYSQSEWNSD